MRKFSHQSLLLSLSILALCFSCKDAPKKQEAPSEKAKTESKKEIALITKIPKGVKVPKGMMWIPGGEFYQGALPHDNMAMGHEKPRHAVAVDGFFMDISEVTNKQYAKFAKETGYVTVAEREIDWEEMKTQLPPGTPKPHDSILQPGSLIFKKGDVANLRDYYQWWEWRIGANWKQPYGPESSIKGKENNPVVHIAYEDAVAYCEWAGKRLPTEAEWEYAARGGNQKGIHYWGDKVKALPKKANTWTGEFPSLNDKTDGYEYRAPVMSYPPNAFGLYDMAGNVWEWTSDWYNNYYYKEQATKAEVQLNPQGALKALNIGNPHAVERVIKGGSFLCSAAYCASYRVSSRMATSVDSSMEHLGFRTVMDIKSDK